MSVIADEHVDIVLPDGSRILTTMLVYSDGRVALSTHPCDGEIQINALLTPDGEKTLERFLINECGWKK